MENHSSFAGGCGRISSRASRARGPELTTVNGTRAAPDASRFTFGTAAMTVKLGNDPSAPRYSSSHGRVNGPARPAP
jgi:hypothetical protein